MHIPGEYYHVYNRGAHKAPIFNERGDYRRFISLLYLANNKKPLVLKLSKPDIFSTERSHQLVDISAYCLMPNHFHLALLEKEPLGIEKFIRKLCTAYVMFYNKKYTHSGTIFQGKYKSKHVDKDEYLNYLLEYIHLNPFGIEEPDISKSARRDFCKDAIEVAKKYEFSSLKDYLCEERPQKTIITKLQGPTLE